MSLKFKLYPKELKKVRPTSEKICLAGFFAFTIVAFLSSFVGENFEFFLKILGFVCLGVLFYGFISHFWEYEKVNSESISSIELDKEKLLIGEIAYPLKELKDLTFDFRNYYGMFQNSPMSITPVYSSGTDNKISFYHNQLKTEFSFQINDKKQMEELQDYIFDIIITEKILFDGLKAPKMLTEKQKRSEKFDLFIKKLLLEKRIECNLGLKLLRLDKYGPGIEILKKKYCS